MASITSIILVLANIWSKMISTRYMDVRSTQLEDNDTCPLIINSVYGRHSS